ncbi:hypothetical protein NMG60_11034178 [Bertholletia excelsa]
MQKPKQPRSETLNSPSTPSRFEFINNSPKLAIPVGPRFQADIPDWMGPPHRECYGSGESKSDASRLSGTQIWPIKARTLESDSEDCIGKGRPESCECQYPGSTECVKHHITNKNIQLKSDVGHAYWIWKFDLMGENVSESWNLEEQKKFDIAVKKNPVSEGKSFMKPALDCLPSKSRESIVNYYFNVYIPRRMSSLTRAGCKSVDTDDETLETPKSKGSKKRPRADSSTSSSSNIVKGRYLTGRR